MTFALDELTGNETTEELEALLDSIEADELEGDEEQEDEAGIPEKTEPEKVDSETEESASSDDGKAEPEEQEEQEPQKGILAKDGENIIPFDVLERERQEKQELQQKLDELQQRQSEFEQNQRLLDVRNKQLEKLGVEPDDLPENLNISDEQLEELKDNYPEVGKIIHHLIAKVNHVSQTQTTHSQTDNESNQSTGQQDVQAVINEISDLSAWQKDGGENWSKALELDGQLQTDPTWKHKPLAERFQEVVRRVNEMNTPEKEPEVKPKAKEKEEQEDALPNSPSEVGQTNTVSQSPQDKLAGASEEDIQAMFSGMTGDQVEALLSEFDI